MEENICEKITSLCEARDMRALAGLLEELNPVDIAEALEGLSMRDTALVYRILPKEKAAEVFVELDSEKQQKLIEIFSDKELRETVNELYVDDTVDIIGEMPATVVAKILKNASPDMRRMINEILLYPEDSAGGIMTPEYVSLKRNFTVEEAFEKIRREGVDKETVYTCYVTENRKLVGIVTVKSMLLSTIDTKIEDIMIQHVISVYTHDDKEKAAEMIGKYGLLALPVVDTENRLVGIVTVDDAIGVMQEEAAEDMEIMAAISPSEKPYMKMGVFQIWKKRIPWLLLLMITATITSKIISSFEAALSACVALTAFIPMLMDTGGNAGSQASVSVIRGLSMDEIEPKDTFRVLLKEVRVSLLCAATLAPVAFLKVLFIDRETMLVSITVAFTLFFTVCLAKVIGCLLPLLAKKMKLDPAVMASPLITTVVDALSLLLYFAFASRILGL